MTIVTRDGKGAPLTHAEMDGNLMELLIPDENGTAYFSTGGDNANSGLSVNSPKADFSNDGGLGQLVPSLNPSSNNIIAVKSIGGGNYGALGTLRFPDFTQVYAPTVSVHGGVIAGPSTGIFEPAGYSQNTASAVTASRSGDSAIHFTNTTSSGCRVNQAAFRGGFGSSGTAIMISESKGPCQDIFPTASKVVTSSAGIVINLPNLTTTVVIKVDQFESIRDGVVLVEVVNTGTGHVVVDFDDMAMGLDGGSAVTQTTGIIVRSGVVELKGGSIHASTALQCLGGTTTVSGTVIDGDISVTGTTATRFVVALPLTSTISSVVDLDALGVDITTGYSLLGIITTVDDLLGVPVAYNVYELSVATPYSANHRHSITISA